MKMNIQQIGYTGKINTGSPEIFQAVFGDKTVSDVLTDAEDAETTIQDYIMSHCIEAAKYGMETDVYEAYHACCEECDVPSS